MCQRLCYSGLGSSPMVGYANICNSVNAYGNFFCHCSSFTCEHLEMSFSCLCLIYRKVSLMIQHSLKTQKTIVWGTHAVKTWKLVSLSYFRGSDMAQAVSCWPLAGRPRSVCVRLMMDKVALGQIFLLVLKLYPASYHSISYLYPHSFIWHQCYKILAVDIVVK